ncbi:MAG: hypothetical protein WKF73_15570 [Nocardioidaceae bacterium]
MSTVHYVHGGYPYRSPFRDSAGRRLHRGMRRRPAQRPRDDDRR